VYAPNIGSDFLQIQNPDTKANDTSANNAGFSKLKLGIGSTHPTVPTLPRR
jgi:hypothetical protein